MQRKGYAKQILIGIGILVLILDGKTALAGATDGIELCLRSVVPSLFPFFILSDLLVSSIWGASAHLLRIPGKLFRVPHGAESLLVCSLLGGYPVGAKEISCACQEGRMSKEDALRLLSFCNQPGPAFLFGMVAPCLGSQLYAWLLWGIILLSAWCVSTLTTPTGKRVALTVRQPSSPVKAMSGAIRTMGGVCGWIIIFRTVYAFLTRWFLWLLPNPIQVVISGVLELSSGCAELAQLGDFGIRFVAAAFLLSFGGLCVQMQTASVLGQLPLLPCLLGKITQSVFAGILACAAVYGGMWYAAVGVIAICIFLFRKKGVAFSGNPVYNV